VKQINLIPSDYAYSRYLRRRVTIWAELALAVSAMIAALGFNLHGQVRAAEKEYSRLAAKHEMQKQVSAEIHELAEKRKATIEKLKELYATQRKRVYSAILDDIAAACNERVFLVEVTAAPPGAKTAKLPRSARTATSEPQEKATMIGLKGSALTNLDLTRFVSKLSESEALRDVNLKFWRQGAVGQLKLITFEVECYPSIEG